MWFISHWSTGTPVETLKLLSCLCASAYSRRHFLCKELYRRGLLKVSCGHIWPVCSWETLHLWLHSECICTVTVSWCNSLIEIYEYEQDFMHYVHLQPYLCVVRMLGLAIYSAKRVVTIFLPHADALSLTPRHDAQGYGGLTAPGSWVHSRPLSKWLPLKSQPLSQMLQKPVWIVVARRPCLLRKSSCEWWRFSPPLTEQNSRDLDVSAAIQMSDIYTHIWILFFTQRIIGCL